MPKQLKQLLIDRVDLVDRGDNPKATIELYKRKEDSGGKENEFNQKGEIQVTDAMKKLLGQIPPELGTKIAKQMSAEEEAKRKKQEEEEKRKKQEDEDMKRKKQEEEEERKKQEEEEEEEKQEEEEEEKQEEEEERKKQEEEDEEKRKKREEDEERKKAEGSLDEETKKRLPENVRKQLQAYEKRIAASEAVTKKLQNEILVKEYIAKARTFKYLSVSPEVLGPVLKRVAQAAPDDYAKLESVLRAADTAIAKNNLLVEELGRAGHAVGGSAWQKVEAAAEVMKAADPGMSKEVAVAKVLMSNPELHKQYRDEVEEVQ